VKFLKWFSLFFVSMVPTLLIGMLIGFRMEKYFYPGEKEEHTEAPAGDKDSKVVISEKEDKDLQVVAVSGKEEKLNANTNYICIEYDMMTGEEVPVSTKLPAKYIGLGREQFIECLKEYEQSPPLEERERGFISVELQRFSSEEVEVLMNYKYVQPSENFYIVVYNDKIRVLLEDKKTVYLETGILAYELPLDLQQEIMQGMFVHGEEALYDFLENYTS